jgi:hypothetical protein
MKRLLASAICALLPLTALADSAGYKVSYDGGSIPEKAGTAVYSILSQTHGGLPKRAVAHLEHTILGLAGPSYEPVAESSSGNAPGA